MKVEGVDYTPNGIEAVRERLSELREKPLSRGLDGIEEALVLTHAIAYLAHLIELIVRDDSVI